jgi:hypothetical protein
LIDEHYIVELADAFKFQKGHWPKQTSGAFKGDCWGSINSALIYGLRGLPGGDTLPKLLARERGVRNIADISPLSEKIILKKIRHYKKKTGRWPKVKSKKLTGEEYSWSSIDNHLRKGSWGLKKGSSLRDLMERELGVPNRLSKHRSLTEKQILKWADDHFRRVGEFPVKSRKGGGCIAGTDWSWSKINDALIRGSFGLERGSSLAKLLETKRGVVNIHNQSEITVQEILQTADNHKEKKGSYPNVNSGRSELCGLSWKSIDGYLRNGNRGLPENSSLAIVLEKHRGKKNNYTAKKLNYEQILQWGDDFYQLNSRYPNKNDGRIQGTNETWKVVEASMTKAQRGLTYATTLRKLFEKHRGMEKRTLKSRALLNNQQVVEWAKSYKNRTGKRPSVKSGPIPETENDSWHSIHTCIQNGWRGLTRQKSLAKFLSMYSDI